MLNKVIKIGYASKAVHYLIQGIGSTANLTGRIAGSVHAGFTNKQYYDVTLTTEGGQVVKELSRQTTKEIADILDQMDNFGIKNVDICKSKGVLDDNNE